MSIIATSQLIARSRFTATFTAIFVCASATAWAAGANSPANSGHAGKNSSATTTNMTAKQLRELDTTLGNRFWDFPYPSYANTVTQDMDGFRSTLAQYGIGFSALNISLFESNLLNTPSRTPTFGPNGLNRYPTCTRQSSTRPCAGGQAYVGQSPFFQNSIAPTLVFDTSRWGVPDGTFTVSGQFIYSTNPNFVPSWAAIQNLLWHQSAFDQLVELNIGYGQPLFEFIGSNVAGNFASTFGPAATIPGEMGLAQAGGVPQAEVKFNLPNNFYNQFMVAKSQPTNGQLHDLTGNPFRDEQLSNPSGFRFLPNVPGTRSYVIDELGYKVPADVNQYQTWIRAGYIHNFSDFQDLSKLPGNLESTAVLRGADAGYLLADQQIWQFAPGSKQTAYRGLYVGGSAFLGQENALAFSQAYEARAYMIGPLDSRPEDLVSFVYTHQKVSHYLSSALNTALAGPFNGGFAAPMAAKATNTSTLTYLAHIRPGLYTNLGISYTDNPSLQYFKGEGHALELLFSVVTVF